MRHLKNCAHALPIDDRLFREPFYVTHAGWERVQPRESYPRPGHPSCYGYTWSEGRVLGEFCLSLILSGRGELQTKLGAQPLQADRAFLYRPGEWHRHRPDRETGWFNLWINFNGSLPHQWVRDGAFDLDQNLVRVKTLALFKAQFRHLVESIHTAPTRNSLVFSWRAIGLVSHFLRDPVSESHANSTRSADPLVDAAMDCIWSQSHNQIGVADVVAQVGVNRRTLERRFRAVHGSTLLNEIHRCRVSRAALLLRQTDAAIKYVVGRAGFASYQQQRQAFQKHFQLSPDAYRKSAR